MYACHTYAATLATLTGLAWFATMIASLSYTNDYIQVVNGNDANQDLTNQKYAGNLLQQYYSFFNLYAFRTIALFASLMVTYNADRHYLSRGAAWTSWVVNTCLTFNWASTDLPFVYSIFNYFSEQPLNAQGQPNGPLLTSHRSQFCGAGQADHWYTHTHTHTITPYTPTPTPSHRHTPTPSPSHPHTFARIRSVCQRVLSFVLMCLCVLGARSTMHTASSPSSQQV